MKLDVKDCKMKFPKTKLPSYYYFFFKPISEHIATFRAHLLFSTTAFFKAMNPMIPAY